MTLKVPASLYALEQSKIRAGARQPEVVNRLLMSVVVPMFNEQDSAVQLVEEIASALSAISAQKAEGFEIIIVDDGSKDDTKGVLIQLKTKIPQLRLLVHGKNAGQSRSLRTAILAAQAPVIATLDGDGQNNPADIPALYQKLIHKEAPGLLAMVAGERQNRQDTAAKRYASLMANSLRRRLLGDDANDTGCGLKVFYRDAFLRLPYFDHFHRYLPALIKREGLEVAFVPVGHRARMHGTSKYTNFQRALVAVRDLMGVIWLKGRARLPETIEEL